MVLFLASACCGKPGISKPLFDSTNDDDSLNTVVFAGNISSDSIAEMSAVLKLFSNNTFQAEASEEKTGSLHRSAGRYEVEKNTIILKPDAENVLPLKYAMHENRLVVQKENQSETDTGYLERLNHNLLEIYWKLEELNGDPIKSMGDDSREAHIVFRTVDKRAVGNTGCNGFSSRFDLLKGNTIKFSPVMSTKMACMEIDYEGGFFRMLEMVNRYEIVNDTLLLKYNTETVSRFSKSVKKTTRQ
jgi:heat shock protein HslJ